MIWIMKKSLNNNKMNRLKLQIKMKAWMMIKKIIKNKELLWIQKKNKLKNRNLKKQQQKEVKKLLNFDFLFYKKLVFFNPKALQFHPIHKMQIQKALMDANQPPYKPLNEPQKF